MNRHRTVARTKTRLLCLGGALVLGLSTAQAGGINEMAARCENYGPGFVDMGNGTCARSSTHIRVGTRAASINAWATDGTSNAGLRSDASGMVPRAGDASHLRVRNGLESLSPFR